MRERGGLVLGEKVYTPLSQRAINIRDVADSLAERVEKVGVSGLNSFSSQLLPASSVGMHWSREVYEDYQRILQDMRERPFEFAFEWFGDKEIHDGKPVFNIKKAILINHVENQLANDTCGAYFPIGNIEALAQHNVHIKGHSHPVQNEESRRKIGLDKIDKTVLEKLAIRDAGLNFSLADIKYFKERAMDSDYDERTLMLGTILFDGEFMSLALGNGEIQTIRNITADTTDGVVKINTNAFEQEKSNAFFGAGHEQIIERK